MASRLAAPMAAAPAPAGAPKVETTKRRKAPEPDADGEDQATREYLLGEGGSSYGAIQLLRRLAAQDEKDKDDEEAAFAEYMVATQPERLAWLSAVLAQQGLPPLPRSLLEPYGPDDLADLDDDPDLSILKPEDSKDGKRRLGKDGLVRYYV